MHSVRILLLVLVCLVIVAAGIGGCALLVVSGPKAPKDPPERRIQKVRVVAAEKRSVRITLATQGEVEPLRRTTLSAEVGGKLAAVSERFEPGETFAEGDLILQIDPSNYEVALARAEAEVREVEVARTLEAARGEQAGRDWEKLRKFDAVAGDGPRGEPSDLVLRKPQLRSAAARVAAADAARKQALDDLARTRITAPYDCRVEATMVDLGAVVSPGMQLLRVVSLGPVQVRLPLSLEDYGYLQRTGDGSVTGEVTARGVIGGGPRTWTGRLVRSEEIVSRETRSIHVVAEFGRDGSPAPLVGMFVQAGITGRQVDDIVRVNRSAMVGPSQLLVVDDDDRLEFREVAVLRTEADTVLVSGNLEAGERVLATALSAPVKGMPVEVVGEGTAPGEPAAAPQP